MNDCPVFKTDLIEDNFQILAAAFSGSKLLKKGLGTASDTHTVTHSHAHTHYLTDEKHGHHHSNAELEKLLTGHYSGGII